MHSLGLVWGWALMAFGSLVSCGFLFWLYDKQKIDWLYAKTAKEWEESKGEKKTWFQRQLLKLFRYKHGKIGILTFTVANLALDPLVAAVHYRESHFGGISRRDWTVLLGSVVISNIYWGIRIGVLVKILEWLFGRF
jgi:hypothetical protein